MPSNAKFYRVFVASPGGLESERYAFRESLNESNDTDAVERGALFIPVGWEFTLPGCGRPQALINQDIEKCDYFVLILRDRWGSPTDAGDRPKYTSGIEEEYHVALKCFEDFSKPMRQLIVLFKSADIRQLGDPGPQLRNVLDFRAKLEREKKLLFDTFDDVTSLKQKLRRNLSAWLRDHEKGTVGKITKPELPPAPPEPSADDPTASEYVDLVRSWNPSRPHAMPAESELAQEAAKGDPQALLGYAEMLMSAGRNSQATDLFEKALALSLEPLERARALRGFGRMNLNVSTPNFRKAEQLFMESLSILETLGAPAEEDLVGLVINMGGMYRASARYEESERYLRRALSFREKQDPPNYPGTAFAHYNLAHLFYQQTRYLEAKPFAEKALQIRRARSKNIPLVMAQQLTQIGSIARALGSYELAEGYLTEGIAQYEKAGREENLTTGLVALGILRRNQSRFPESKDLIRRAVVIRERARGPENDSVGFALLELAETLRLLGEFEDSEVAYKRALLVRERILGRQHPSIARNIQGLALLYLTQGGAHEAELLLLRALAIFRDRVGTAVPAYARCQRDLAKTYLQTGRLEEAAVLARDAASTLEIQLSSGHPETVEAIQLCANILTRQSRTEGAPETETKSQRKEPEQSSN
jgi:tetratricopeptide (TPR) repeat protein